jgi:hypothetical protein
MSILQSTLLGFRNRCSNSGACWMYSDSFGGEWTGTSFVSPVLQKGSQGDRKRTDDDVVGQRGGDVRSASLGKSENEFPFFEPF